MKKVSKSIALVLAVASLAVGAELVGKNDSNTVHASTITVKDGDTLWGYSQKYNVSLDSILKENNISLDSYVMWDGDEINIPDGKPHTGSFTNHFVKPQVVQAPVTNTVQSTSAPVVQQQQEQTQQPAVQSEAPVVNSYSGQKLTASAGVVQGPSGKESYYNMDMSTVVANANAQGISGSQWVRSDGAKMLGNYVMVAANLSVHPRGSIVSTSLGSGIVVDTGTFAASNQNQLDIATAW